MNRTPFIGRSRTITESSSSTNNDSFLQRFISGRPSTDIILEEVIDVENDMINFGNNTINLPNPNRLYQVGRWHRNTGLFSHSSERSLSIIEESQTIINLVSPEAAKKLKNKNYKYFHPGIIVIGIKGLIRRHVGAKLLIVIYDDRWTNNINSGLLAITEVDLNENKGLFYFSPGYFMEIKDFMKHIKIGFKVKGFEGFIASNNIIICTGIMGKCMNNTTLNFKINIENVIEKIASKGIQLIEPPKISANENAGLEWDLSTIFDNQKPIINPTSSIIYKNMKGGTSIRFREYQNVTAPNLEESSDDDIQEIQNKFDQ